MTAHPEPRNIAILIDHLHPYQAAVISGIRDVLDRHGFSSTVYIGRDLLAPDAARTANCIFSMVDARKHAGLIALSVSLGIFCTEDELLAFLQGFGDIPRVSLGRKLPGMVSVVVNNQAGMQDLMAHLIRMQGHQRFAFIRGLAGNLDSMEREQIFREALQDAHLEVREDFFLNGEYSSQESREQVTRLLQRTHDLDVVVCANDEMAEGAIQAINQQGLRVPEDIAVVGFDDSDHFRHVTPALTTVKQPMKEQGQLAAQTLLDMLAIHPVPAVLEVPTALVVRESCGGHGGQQRKKADLQLTGKWQDHLQQVLTLLREAAKTREIRPFLAFWKETLFTQHYQAHDFTFWEEILFQCLQQVEEGLSDDQLRFFNHLKTLAHGTLFSAMQMEYSEKRILDLSNSMWNPRLFSSETNEQLLQEIQHYLQRSQIHRYLLVFSDGMGLQGTSRVVLHRELVSEVEESTFATRDLIPASLLPELHAGHHLITPLFVGEDYFGLLLYVPTSTTYFDEEGLCSALSRAIQQLRQHLALKAHAETLEREVQARTMRLKAEIAERTRAEKALQAANLELQRSAFLDGLTRIYNRAAFNDHLDREWADHLRSGKPLSLILCDVDFFKKYNDHYGHLQGDECLREVARALSQSVRRGDTVARYGGEEFAVILPDTDEACALLVAQRMQLELLGLQIPHDHSEVSPVVTMSMGVSTLTPSDCVPQDTLIARADQNLYRAKHQGRNRVVCQGPV
ncbi:diguanylate cyclase domain-containing protein [Deinococcus roseus]|uniref:GGDEF domain-containing protein n=1 Tax=Deinococcus roseus TaxID=392414 RepID=A0ABQ2CZ46_9DEIO|nr:diguanylate cyclase [Deinococcus roseus]GGJ28061.1 hypothetical protein GCM10008938_12700 [Deinococcus roseus]